MLKYQDAQETFTKCFERLCSDLFKINWYVPDDGVFLFFGEVCHDMLIGINGVNLCWLNMWYSFLE